MGIVGIVVGRWKNMLVVGLIRVVGVVVVGLVVVLLGFVVVSLVVVVGLVVVEERDVDDVVL